MRDSESRPHGLYRSTKNKRISGVCAGIAEYFDLSAGWIRFGMIILLFISGFSPMVIVAYFIAALIMKPCPVYPIQDDDEKEFYDAYTSVPKYTIQHISQKFKDMERRIQRMEDHVTARAYDWERKFQGS
jgi:phage shock protein C